MKNLETLAYDAGIMPVLFAEEAGCAERVVGAIERTALPGVEILQRGPYALDAFREAVGIRRTALVGAGTVCSLDQCRRMVDLGADFIVSPGCDLPMVDWCVEHGVPIVPGVSTVSELMAVSARGVRLVKFFPFHDLGGEKYLNSFSGPFPDVKFIITGFTDDRELPYLRNRKIAAVGGVWIFQSEEDHTVIGGEEIVYRANRSLELARHYRKGW